MSASTDAADPHLSFRRHGEVAVVDVSADIESLPASAIETAAQVVLSPLKADPPANVICPRSSSSRPSSFPSCSGAT